MKEFRLYSKVLSFPISCIGLSIVFLLSGCVIKSAQLRELNNHLRDSDEDLKPYLWLLRWNQYENKVYPVNMNPVFVFGNTFGDAITTQSFTLKEAQGLGKFNYLWQFIEKNGFIMAYESGQLQDTYLCSDWKTRVSEKETVNVIQECIDSSGRVIHNKLVLHSDGSIKKVIYDLFGDKSPLVLEKI